MPPCIAMAGLMWRSMTCATRSATSPSRSSSAGGSTTGLGELGLLTTRPPRIRSSDQSIRAPRIASASLAGTTTGRPSTCSTVSSGAAMATGFSERS